MGWKRVGPTSAMRIMLATAMRIAALGEAGGLAQPVQAQAPATDAGKLSDAEALARAQRTADRVKEFIVMNSKFDAVPALGAKAPVRQGGAVARPAIRSTATRVALLPPAPGAPPATVDIIPSAATPPSPQGSMLPSAGADVSLAHGPPAAASLFDFETSTEGFTLHSLADWVELPAKGLTLTPQAAHGRYALQAVSPTDAWLGVDLSDAVDFSALKRLTFWMRSAHGAAGRLAVKSGLEYDWCELRPIAIGAADGFVHYEVFLQAGGHECKNLDLGDVRGLHWFVRAGDSIILDDVELR